MTIPANPAVARVDMPSFEHIFREHRGRVLSTVRSVIGNIPEDELEDVVQLVFLEVYRCLDRFEGRSKLTTWLYRISANVALQHIRRKKRKRWLTLGLTGNEPERAVAPISQTRRLEDREMLELVRKAAERLTLKKRTVWALHDLQGLSTHEVAESLQVPHNTVRSRLLAARRSIKEELIRMGALTPGAES